MDSELGRCSPEARTLVPEPKSNGSVHVEIPLSSYAKRHVITYQSSLRSDHRSTNQPLVPTIFGAIGKWNAHWNLISTPALTYLPRVVVHLIVLPNLYLPQIAF